MQFAKTIAAGACAAALLLIPAPGMAASASDAENLRRLDIMLMVTSLRCRMGPHNFQPEYRQFSANHLVQLNSAARQLERGLVGQHGATGARRALDRISVSMANEYGQGHPWLDCSALKQIATDLAASHNPEDLDRAAAELLADSPARGGRFAAR